MEAGIQFVHNYQPLKNSIMFTGKVIMGAIACAFASYFIAKSRGFKNPIIWGLAGLFGTFLVVAIVTFIKKKVDEKNKAK